MDSVPVSSIAVQDNVKESFQGPATDSERGTVIMDTAAPTMSERPRSTRASRVSLEEMPPQKRRKTGTACLFCRRSHMTCDEQRPCTRCVKREIGHLCRDEPPAPPKAKGAAKGKKRAKKEPSASPEAPALPPNEPAVALTMPTLSGQPQPLTSASTYSNSLAALSEYPVSAFDDQQPLRNEFYGPNLSDFLRSFDDPTLFGTDESLLPFIHPFSEPVTESAGPEPPKFQGAETTDAQEPPNALPKPSKDERYLMTAADQKDGPRDERLARVIHAKYEAGLLKPFDYVAGYKRLSRWMETHMSASSRQRTLQTISEFRPAFRSIAASLTDLDLVFIEEAFERLLLDYDRMFANMPIPACLWRRTGEIFKANVEFAQLVGVPIEQLKEGRMAIYELMAGESAGNYWERWGRVCFDSRQKAVLTTCILRNQTTKKDLPCAFSFTIRRDAFNLPNAVVGNFLPTPQQANGH